MGFLSATRFTETRNSAAGGLHTVRPGYFMDMIFLVIWKKIR